MQFEAQARRELARFRRQLPAGRQTLPYDYELSVDANVENNVRSRWVDQGIWGDEWGPAWPKGMRVFWNLPIKLPADHPCPHGPWGHEAESEPEPEPEPKDKGVVRQFGLFLRQKPERPELHPVKYIKTPFGLTRKSLNRKPAVRNPEASRPYHQFLYQLSKEREWIEDEVEYRGPGGRIDLDAMAYERTKKNWIEDGIWNPEWGELPGMTWHHEVPEEEEVIEKLEEVGATSPWAPACRRLRHAADGNSLQPPWLHGPVLSEQAPIPTSSNSRTDDCPTPAFGGAESFNAEGRINRQEDLGPGPVVAHDVQGLEETSLRPPPIATSPKECTSSGSSATKHRSQQGSRSAEPTELTELTNVGISGELDRSPTDQLDKQRSKDQGVEAGAYRPLLERSAASASGRDERPKRSRDDDSVDNEAPSRRLRYKGLQSGLARRKTSDAGDATSNEVVKYRRTVVKRNKRAVKQLPGKSNALLTRGGTQDVIPKAAHESTRGSARTEKTKNASLTGRRMRGLRSRTVDQPPSTAPPRRHSARIEEREKRRGIAVGKQSTNARNSTLQE